MNFDYEGFKESLKNVTRSTYETALTKMPPEDLCGFALYSDESAMSISVTINSAPHLAANRERKPRYADYYRWSPGEWKYETVNIAAFKDLNDLLQAALKEVDQGSWRKHRNRIYDSAVRALEELKKEGLFKDVSDDFVLMFAVSELSEQELEIEWVERLNRKSLAEEFAAWLETEED